jgi:two-component system cell cycle sensor histidine kinase/response regulator CckA
MEKQFKILHLEDDRQDAELIHAVLGNGELACEITHVASGKAFPDALGQASFDLILSDFSLPDWTGLQALEWVKQKCPGTPFIFVSGTMGEDTAIGCLRSGATDYVLKQNLKRLAPAVQRALREVEERREKEQLEEKFRQAQKMEIVGQFAGGIAHDFNNLLTVILGHVQLLLESKNSDPELMDSLKNIHHAAEAAGGLTGQLLAFSRKQALQPKVLDLNGILSALGNMLSRILDRNISLEKEFADVPPILADAGMLEQMVMNLAVNARDAMPKGGRLILRSGWEEINAKQAALRSGSRPGRFVYLSVSDTGTGIPPEFLGHLFEPFFTTKGPGKGTGLGLTSVYGIAQRHQGWIEVKSEVGRGTEFKVFFPETSVPLVSPSPDSAPATPARTGETLLIVEGEPALRNFIRAVLEDAGYRILEAGSGAEALRLWERLGAETDLVLTEMILSDGMTGPELTALLETKKPGLKVIYSSGYGLDAFEGKPAPRNSVFLQRPFPSQLLTRMVRDCLDQERVG